MAAHAIGSGSLVAGRFGLDVLLAERLGAQVWRAHDDVLARSVSLHALPGDDTRASALLEAARQSATLSDPRVLRVLDAFEEDGIVYVVHEWGSGVTLDRLAAGEELAPRRVAWLVREVAEALAHAHGQSLSHGHLLPEHVLLTNGGSVRMIDFAVHAALAQNPIGLRGVAADLEALPALLYAGLVGHWPGANASVLPAAPRNANGVCRPRQVRARVSRRLQDVWSGLSTAPVTAAETAALLDGYLHHHEPPTLVAPLDLAGEPGQLAAAREGAYDPDATHWAIPAWRGEPAGGPQGLGGSGPSPARDTVAPNDSPDLDDAGAPSDRAMGASVLEVGSDSGAPIDSDQAAAVGDLAADPEFAPLTVRAPTSIPRSWGPDPLPEDTESDPGIPGSLWWRLAALVAALSLIIVAAVIATGLSARDLMPSVGRDEASGTPATIDISATPDPVKLAGISDFDPEQDGGVPEEYPELVPLAVDGKARTAWRTSTYVGGPALAPYKAGVGLLLDLGTTRKLSSVSLRLVGQGYSISLLVPPDGADAPTSLTGLTSVVDVEAVGGRTDLVPTSATVTRYAVVWLTALPAVTGGYQGQVAEVVVRS